eukprot:TRINITY_DN959_c0_g1_i3.p1 TRINITY_DN959_c0_g1~~TRINITY_DN959_c0_g1_i3.p1  ORF type:complete len:313 (-),score=77.47 TRINITY_DN959_c0_g1_i3:601-1539(-)
MVLLGDGGVKGLEEEEDDPIFYPDAGEVIPSEIDWHHLNIWKFTLWNSIFFVAVRTVLYPTILVKTKLQTQKDNRYSGMIDAFKQIWRIDGRRGLYRGFITTTSGILPVQFISMITLEFLRAHIPNSKGGKSSTSAYNNFIAGFVSSSISTVIVVPVDVISQRLMIQEGNKSQNHYKGGFDAFQKIVKSEGLRGLYRGYVATIITHAPSNAIFWTTYTKTKKWLSQYDINSVFAQAFSACFAGIVGGTLTNPTDVIKTRIQVSRNDGHHLSSQSPSIRTVFKDLVQKDGVLGLFRGCQARAINQAYNSMSSL